MKETDARNIKKSPNVVLYFQILFALHILKNNYILKHSIQLSSVIVYLDFLLLKRIYLHVSPQVTFKAKSI